jgi:hypothetical protein
MRPFVMDINFAADRLEEDTHGCFVADPALLPGD